MQAIDPAQLVFVDESGANTAMTRRYGRSARGRRVREAAPAGHWRILTVLGAMSRSGVVASMTIPEPTDGDIFRAFVEQVLGPRLQPGQVVVMDNLSAHKVAGVRELIEDRGAQLLYLPPYSPDFNPIEQCWSKIKETLRALQARALPLLDEAMAQALATISAQNAEAWFRHCGYGDTATTETL